MAIGAGRKIAVAAINVAERRRLQNEKARGPGEFRQAHAFRQALFHGCATRMGDDADTASRPPRPTGAEEICCKYALRIVSKRSIGCDRFNWLGLAIADDDVIKSARSTPSRTAVPFLSTAFSRTLLTFDLLCRFLGSAPHGQAGTADPEACHFISITRLSSKDLEVESPTV